MCIRDRIKAIEEAYAKTETPVVSNNSAHRWTPDVPMVVPEINPEHFEVIKDCLLYTSYPKLSAHHREHEKFKRAVEEMCIRDSV